MIIDNFLGRSIGIESKPMETQEGEHRAARTAKSSSFQTILLRLSVLLFPEIEIGSCPKTFFKEALEAPEKPPRISCCQ